MRVPPVFYCPLCEVAIKIKGLRNGNPAQFIPKPCSACVADEQNAKTGADRVANRPATNQL